MIRSNSSSSFSNQSGMSGTNSTYGSMPNIAVAVRNIEKSKNSTLIGKPGYYEEQSTSGLHSQRNPLLVQEKILKIMLVQFSSR
jgi:hypothetical protein